VLPPENVLHALARFWVGQSRLILLFALVTLGLFVGPAVTTAAQLTLSWVDNAGGQAGFIIQRATGTSGPYTQIAQTPLGTVSYSDGTVSLGTTYCYQVAAVNSAGTSSFSAPACGSPSGGFTLTAAKAGTAAGIVGSSPGGINCGTACTYTYPANTAVTLAATPASGSIFSGWTSGGCTGTDPCTLAGNGSVTVTATFAALPGFTLTVNKSGPGTVSSSPGGISCGSTCSVNYPGGSVVTLTAVPRRGAHFDGWSGGGCSGTGTCTVTLNTAMSVTASFSKGGRK
jgi:hypothetical protein